MSFEHKHNWLLILQGWSILWIVIGNTFLGNPGSGPVWESILLRTAYSFHLPLLMFVCGCIFEVVFLSENNVSAMEQFKNQLLAYIAPFFLFTFIALIIKTALSETLFDFNLLTNDFIHGILYPGEKPMSPLWFMMVLIWLHLLLPVWKYVLEKSWTTWLLLVLLLFVHLFTFSAEFLCIRWACYFAIYFFAGILVMKKRYIDQFSGMNGFFIFVLGYLVYLFGVDFDKTIAEFGGIAFSIGISVMLSHVFPKTFSTFRDYYFQIFILGYFVQILFRLAFSHLSIPYALGYFVCLLTGIYVPVMISKILQSVNFAPLHYCVGLFTKMNVEKQKYKNQIKLMVE